MTHTSFWDVQPRSANRDVWMTIGSPGSPELPSSELNRITDLIQTGEVDDLEPIHFWRYNSGKRLGDLIWTGTGAHIASARFVETLRGVGATGWKTYPVILHRTRTEQIDGYQGFSITGRCDSFQELIKALTPADMWTPEEQMALPEGMRAKMARGFDFSQGWDGTDVFAPAPLTTHAFLVTERVMAGLRDAGATEFDARAADQLELPV